MPVSFKTIAVIATPRITPRRAEAVTAALMKLQQTFVDEEPKMGITFHKKRRGLNCRS